MPATPTPVRDSDERFDSKNQPAAMDAVVVTEPAERPRPTLSIVAFNAASPAEVRAALCIWRT